MKTGITCADAMTTDPVKVRGTVSIPDCALLMKEKHVGALLVVENNLLKGIITEQDIVRRLVAEGLDPKHTIAEDILSRRIYTIRPGDDIFEALMIMKDENVRHITVMEKGTLLGLVTAKDILKIEPQLFELLAEKIELKEESRKPLAISEGNCEDCGEFVEKLYFIKEKTLCKACIK